MQQALLASQDDDAASAIELLTQARKEDPGSAWACFLLGAQLAQSGRYDEAEIEYANAVLLAPELTIARYELGTLQFTSGRAAVALIISWQPLLSLPEEHYLNQFVRGYAALVRDDLAEACARFEQGVAANTDNLPLNGNIQLLLGRIRAATLSAPSGQAEAVNEHFLLSSYSSNLH